MQNFRSHPGGRNPGCDKSRRVLGNGGFVDSQQKELHAALCSSIKRFHRDGSARRLLSRVLMAQLSQCAVGGGARLSLPEVVRVQDGWSDPCAADASVDAFGPLETWVLCSETSLDKWMHTSWRALPGSVC